MLVDDYTARLAAVESVKVRARVGGYLEKVNFKEGQFVKKGDLLFVIDTRSCEMLSANAALLSAQAVLRNA